MFRRFGVTFAIQSIFLDLSFTWFAFWLSVRSRPDWSSLAFVAEIDLETSVPLVLNLIVPLLWVSIYLLASVYDPRRIYKAVDEFQLVSLASGFAALVLAGLLYLFFRDVSRWLFLVFVFTNLTFLLSWRLVARLFFRLRRVPAIEQRVLIVGAGEVGLQVGRMIGHYAWTGLDLIGYLDDDVEKQRETGSVILGDIQAARCIVETHRINDVVIALPRRAYGQVNHLVVALSDLPVRLRVVPDYFSLALFRATVDDFGGIPMINLRDPALNEVQWLVKRLFDLVVGSLTTLLLLPLMGLVALLVRLDSPGPVIFRQTRVGENGRLFSMYKFRSMLDGAEQLQAVVNEENGSGDLIHKKPDDPRVTRLGRLLRRTSLDELPQLFNVLKGEMSLVGPRPELPWMLDQYEPWQHKRFAVPQGMTGWWQVNGRSEKPMHLHTDDDLYYVQNYSLWMDIYILVKTPWVVLRGKGAY